MSPFSKGSINLKSPLWIVLVIFITIDVLLLLYYLPTSFPQKSLTLNNNIPKKEFKSLDSGYPISPGQVKSIASDSKNLYLEQVMLTGYIESLPLSDNNTEVKFKVSFPLKKIKDSVFADVVLGRRDDKVGFLLAKDGVIEKKQSWGAKSVSDLVSYFKRGSPIILQLPIQKAPNEFFNDSRCNSSCKNYFEETDSLYDNNVLLVKMIKGDFNLNEKLEVGIVSQMILYFP